MTTTLLRKNNHFLPILILIAASISIFVFFQQTQSPLSHRGGMGWDGGHYYALAEQIIDGEPITGARPLVYRIGAPALVAGLVKLGLTTDIKEGFFFVNTSFAFASIFVIYFIISRFLDPWIALTGGILFPMHWINAARHMFYTPLWSDPGGLFFLYLGLAFLIALHDRRQLLSFALTILTFLGMLFREFVLLLPILFVLTQYPPRTMLEHVRARAWSDVFASLRSLLLPLAGALAAVVLIRFLVEPQTSYSFWKSAMYHLWVNSPQFYLYSYFSTFGIAIIYLFLQGKFVIGYLKSRPVMLYFVGIIFIAGFIGGDNNERYLNWAFPFFFVLTVKSMIEERISLLMAVAMAVFYVVFVSRLPWPIADYRADAISPFPIFTYLTDDFRFQDLFVLHSSKNVTGIIFYEYLIACGALVVYLRRRQIQKWIQRWLSETPGGEPRDAPD